MGSIDDLYRSADAVALAGHVRAGEVSAAELTEAAIRAIEALNPRLNAVIHRLDDMARKQVAAGVSGPLAGVPYLLKELASSWTGAPVTNSSRYLRDQIATSDSTVVGRIKAAGLVLVGKSNAPENGWSIATEPVLYGPTLNPWDASVTPGGSSGGTAAAVASGMVPIGESSDGAGSIRVPASCCGVVGLKPSRGRVTLAPLADYWMGGAYFLCNSRTVRDTATYLDAVAGGLPGDPYPCPLPDRPFADLAREVPKGLRVGFTVSDPTGNPVHPDVATAVRATARTLEGLGHHVSEYDMTTDLGLLWRSYTDMSVVEAAGFWDWMETVTGRPVTPEEVEPVTWAIIKRGRATMATAHAGRVEQLRQTGRAIVTELLPFDIYLTPTLTQPPRPAGFYDMSLTDLDAYNALWADAVFMAPFNVSGQPAMSLLLGMAGHLPVGVQVVGCPGDEATVLQVASLLEQMMPWRDRNPPVRL
ncbi:MAG: amidase [Rhodobacter sp.]|nr:amidase [Rhodobacter sp.]